MPDVSRSTAMLVAIVLTASCAVGDLLTGVDVAFTLLYVIPIAVATWYAGFHRGVWFAALATGSSIACAMIDERPVLVTMWNELGVMVLFVGLAYLLDRHHAHLAQERLAHQSTVDQLRHSDRLNVIGTLAAGVAHEIGTPLNVISGTAELMPHADDPRDLERMAHVICEQTERISAIIRHLLDFGRRGGDHATTVDLRDLAQSSTVLLAPIARKRSITLEVIPSIGAVPVVGNVAELEQVISNLILNAIQAMSRGGTIRLHAELAPGQGALVVEDDGPGIAPDALPHIFEPFFTTKGVGEGTGLGLSVSYGIVRDHGGTIEVESTRGHGARFTVLLPLLATPRSVAALA